MAGLRRLALGALALAALGLGLLCALAPAAHALDASDWTVTPTRGGVKIECHVSGEGTVGVIVQDSALNTIHTSSGDVDTASQPYTCLVFDTSPSVGTASSYILTTTHRLGDGVLVKHVTPLALSAPDRPTGLTATAGAGQVTLSWTDPSDPSIQKYRYQQKEAGGSWAPGPTSRRATTPPPRTWSGA
jgi:hypothetical protein